MHASTINRVKILFTAICISGLGVGSYAQQPTNLPTYNTSKPLAFEREWVAKAPGLTATTILQKGMAEVAEATVYMDGFGRPIQTVARKAALATNGSSLMDTSTASDLVAPHVYDAYGRNLYQLMPFAHSSQNGLFDAAVFTHQSLALTAKYAADGETKFYSENVFGTGAVEARTAIEFYAPGNAWVGSKPDPDPNARRSVKARVYFNSSADTVHRLEMVYGSPGNFGTVEFRDSYNWAGELIKKIATNEDHKQTVQYIDKKGRLLLQKIQLTATGDDGSGSGYEGWLCTYYVYDDMDRLRVVIQPEGVKTLLQNGWNFTSTILNEQCFRYEYDKYGQVVMKKFPGSGAAYMVYDQLGRLVMTQDARMRPQNVWNYTQYDEFNRTVATGTLVNSSSLTSLWAQAGISSSFPALDHTAYQLSATYYDNYDWVGNNGSPFVSGDIAYSSGHDTYFVAGSSGSFPFPESNAATANTKGMVTGSKLAILGGPQYLYALSLYNDKGRAIQTKSFNHTGATTPDIATVQYSWAGQVLTAVNAVTKAGTNALYTVTATSYSYDMLGRLLATTEKAAVTNIATSATVTTEKIPAHYLYDELGQLKTKLVSPFGGAGGGVLETQDYDYNIRGWLLGMNRGYANNSNNSRYFGFELSYDKPPSLGGAGGGLYNGNITCITWRGQAHSARVNRYNFNYDATGRLLKADFGQYNGSVFSNSTIDYTMQAGDGSNPHTAYDANGNLLKMSQYGLTAPGGSTIPVDDLTYQYIAGTNKLAKVTDAITNTAAHNLADFKDGANGGDDYDYDVEGSLVKDENKGITDISYNLLGLVEQVVVQGKGTINYQYSAGGDRLSKTTTPQAGSPVTTLYVGGMVFENNNLQFIAMAGGRIRFNAGNTLVADYFLADHLGNTRLVVSDDAALTDKVLEENHYYPFGLSMAGLGAKQTISGIAANPYKFNAGTELNADFDINLYETAFRGLDPQLGRFWQVDPMAGMRVAENGYCYAANNPVMYTDPDGLLPAGSNPLPYYDWNTGIFHPGDMETGAVSGNIRYNWSSGQYEDEAGNIHSWYVTDSWNRTSGRYENRIGEDMVAAYFNAYWYGYAYGAEAFEKNHKKGFNVGGILHGDGSPIVSYAKKEWLEKKLFYGTPGTFATQYPLPIYVIEPDISSLRPRGLANDKPLGNDLVGEAFGAYALGKPLEIGGRVLAGLLGRAFSSSVAKTGGNYLYHYTSREAAQSISQQGLKVGRDGFSYLTNKGYLSGIQAQIELALPVNRALPNTILKIDVTGMNPAMIRRVTGNMPGYGAGGGTEFLFNKMIPANRITIMP